MTGWPQESTSESLKRFFSRRLEITEEEGCLLWGIRVIIPRSFREHVLKELHVSHPGIVRMKLLALLHVWWPGLDKDIAQIVSDCSKCQLTRNKPPQAPLHPWAWPMFPWQRVHVDFAGPFMGKMFLLVIDSHSKWVEIEIMINTTS